MEDLGEIVGSMMVGMVQARRIADEETAVLAEYYKENPLLEGMSVPRIRVPEMVLEVPMLIEQYQPGKPAQIAGHKCISLAVVRQLATTQQREKIDIPKTFERQLTTELNLELEKLNQLPSGTSILKENVNRAVDTAFKNAIKDAGIKLSDAQINTLSRALQLKSDAVALAERSVPASLKVNVKTAEVKENSSSQNVIRLKVTLKEEGLEWATAENESGAVVRTLQPE